MNVCRENAAVTLDAIATVTMMVEVMFDVTQTLMSFKLTINVCMCARGDTCGSHVTTEQKNVIKVM